MGGRWYVFLLDRGAQTPNPQCSWDQLGRILGLAKKKGKQKKGEGKDSPIRIFSPSLPDGGPTWGPSAPI